MSIMECRSEKIMRLFAESLEKLQRHSFLKMRQEYRMTFLGVHCEHHIYASVENNHIAGRPSPGCLIALDLTGKVINEVKSPEINGPWGSVCTSSGGNVRAFLNISTALFHFLALIT